MKKFLWLFGGCSLLFITWMLAASACRKENYQVLFSDIHLNPGKFRSDGSFLPLNANSYVVFEDLRLMLRLDFHNFVVSNNTLIPSAYAALPSIYNKLDQAKEIQLITLNDYDDAHPAGSDVLDLLSDIDSNLVGMSNREKLIYKINDNGYFKRDFEEIQLRLSRPPSTNSQQFVFQILTTKGSLLRDTTLAFSIH